MWLWVFLGVFAVVAGFNWWVGAWNSMLNLINFYLAALVASSFFEPLADRLEAFNPTYTYVVDFVAVWALFAVMFAGLRITTDLLTKYQLRMNVWADYGVRTFLSIAVAFSFVCFMFFTLHVAPLPPDVFDPATPKELGDVRAGNRPNKLMGFGPDEIWMSLVKSSSRGSLAESKRGLFLEDYKLEDHPDDVKLQARVFDPQANFRLNYAIRRANLSKSETLRVKRNRE